MTVTRLPVPVAASLLILPAAALLAYQIVQEFNFGRMAGEFSPTPLQLAEKTANEARQDLAFRDRVNDGGTPVSSLDDAVRKRRPSMQSETVIRKSEESTVGKERDGAVGHLAATVPSEARRLDQDESAGAMRSSGIRRAASSARPEPETAAEISRPVPPRAVPEASTDSFAAFQDNSTRVVRNDPVSTFSIDVDTASYAFVRRALQEGSMPPVSSVRVEEMINYFSYEYPLPEDATTPFTTTVAVYPTPWNTDTKLLHVGIKSYDIQPTKRPAANIVFLIDVSGSMNEPDKLPLLKSAFRMMLGSLDDDDTVSIVTYAGTAGTVLEPTSAAERSKILRAIDGLQLGGSTAGAAGIEEAYRLASEARIEDGVNRVILATDGDFNVGISDPDALKELVENRRRSGVFLSVLGFGKGNYQDDLMQTLAQNGNGVAAYIDTLNEARKVLVDEVSGSLFTVAQDVKVQIEFNPSTVSEYRLIGYETRALAPEDFNNDRVDAGELGSGHSVTAIYEITPVGSPAQLVDDLRYRDNALALSTVQGDDPVVAGEYAFLKLRYKLPDGGRSRLVTVPVTDAMESADLSNETDDIRFAAAVAAFGQKLRNNRAVDHFSYEAIIDLADGARGTDRFGYRSEFLSLVRLAAALDRN